MKQIEREEEETYMHATPNLLVKKPGYGLTLQYLPYPRKADWKEDINFIEIIISTKVMFNILVLPLLDYCFLF
jgi:hypothetical protein